MAPWRLALVTIMQFAEGLSDRQAADAVRARIDCKYALSLELDDPGFDASVLSEFRTRLLEGGSERLLFDHLLDPEQEHVGAPPCGVGEHPVEVLTLPAAPGTRLSIHVLGNQLVAFPTLAELPELNDLILGMLVVSGDP